MEKPMNERSEGKEWRCGWFGEGRGQCLLCETHRGDHTCEEDGRLLRVAQTGLAAVAERQRQLDAAPSTSHDALVSQNKALSDVLLLVRRSNAWSLLNEDAQEQVIEVLDREAP